MIDLETKIMFGIFVILVIFSSMKYSICFLLFWIFVYLFGFFLTSIGLDIDLVKLENCEIYFQEYTGDYSKLFPKLSEYNRIKRKFKLNPNDYSPFGIFYDDPCEVAEVSKCRAVVGIIKHLEKNTTDGKNGKNEIKATAEDDRELKEYLKNEKFRIITLPDSQCLLGTYSSMFHIQNSFFIWVSKLIIEITNMKFFRRLFIPKWKENKVKVARLNYKKHCGVIEIFKECKIDFYIPVENEKDFFFHSEKNAPVKNKNKKK
jgi:hypothetical protein